MKRIALCGLVLLASCAPITVNHDYDPDVDFTGYQSFARMPMTEEDVGANASLSGPFLDRRIKKSVAEGLSAKGLRYEPEEPDFLIAYQLRYKSKSRVRVDGYGYVHSPYPHRVDVTQYREGTMVVDFVDRRTGELIWRGWAISDLQRAYKPQEEQELINFAVGKLLEHFPPY